MKNFDWDECFYSDSIDRVIDLLERVELRLNDYQNGCAEDIADLKDENIRLENRITILESLIGSLLGKAR